MSGSNSSSSVRLLCLRLRHRVNWRLLKLSVLIAYIVFMFVVVLNVFTKDIEMDVLKKRSASAFGEKFFDPEEIPEEIKAFEALVVPGAGENGAGVSTDSNVEEIVKKYAFNKVASDQISLKRVLPDVRHGTCKTIQYDKDLPSTSVIIIFNNEMLSTLLRTVWSVIRTSPAQYLHEIVLVDDASNITDITHTLPLYLKYRLPDYVILHREPTQLGLIGARLSGAKVATGEAIIFLDSHCEATQGWLEPLIQRIKDKPTNVVIPAIDSVNDHNMQFHGSAGGIGISVGGFTWSGHFTWIPFKYNASRKASDPAPTATMAGGLFGADRKFFFHVGGYDEGMSGWGGENLELSFRVWRCGGSMEAVPCSHVGHVFRAFHPYFIPHDSHGINSARMAEVWMDEYKRLFYMHRTDLDQAKPKPVDIGDLSERMAIKDNLKCKSFKWFLDTVYPEKFILDEHAKAYGRVRNGKYNHICFDHLQRDNAHHLGHYILGQYYCHATLGDSQYFSWSLTKELRNEYMCAEARDDKVQMYGCHSKGGNQDWDYDQGSKALRHSQTGKCVTAPDDKPGTELELRECNGSEEQQWSWEFTNAP